MHYVGTS